MSKSLKRVKAHAEMLGLSIDVIELQVSTKTALEAADAISVEVDQIAKSIVFKGAESGLAVLFLTAGGNRVDAGKAAIVANEPLDRADADFIRAQTGFAIGGVSPIGHVNSPKAFFDPRLSDFVSVWAAAGTPHHMFEIAPDRLRAATQAQVAAFTQER